MLGTDLSLSVGRPSTANGIPPSGGGGEFSNTYSLDFDGTDDYMDVGNDSSLSISGALSITAWIYADSLSGYPMIISKRAGASSHAYQFYSTGSKINYNNGTIVQSTGTISIGAWTHVGVTFDGSGGVSFYINGSSAGTATAASSNPTNSGSVTIGKAYNGNYFDGKIDELAIFNTALSASDVNNIYNSGVPANISSLSPVGWWRMGDTGSDYGTATITNAATGSNSGGSSINGTIENGSSGNTSPTYSTDVPVAPFPNIYSASLDGLDDQVVYNSTSGNQTALGSFTGDMSFCFWVKLSSGSDIMSTHSTYNSATASGTFDGIRTGTGRIAFQSFNNGINAYTSPAYLESSKSADGGGGSSGRGLSYNQWTFIAVTVDTTAQEHKLYTATESLSPSLEATHSSASHALTDFANGFKFGEARSSAGGGLFDEFAIFDGKALSATEVATIWNNGQAFDYGTDSNLNPVGWYRMGDNDLGTGDLVTNAGSAGSGSEYDVSLINGASFVSGSGNTPGN